MAEIRARPAPGVRGLAVVTATLLGCGAATPQGHRAPCPCETPAPPPATRPTAPAWIDRAVVYGAIVARFGGLRGLTDHLDRLAELGVNTLWLSPIHPSPEGDFGYAVLDHFDVRPELGTKQDLRELVQAAHARGVRVVMDFVPNHTSDQHPFFVHAQRVGPASPWYRFYDRDPDGTPTHYFDWENLPNLDYDNPQVDGYVIDAFQYWVRSYDVDGFRVDAAWGVAQRDPDFWPTWAAALGATDPDLLLIAEASARDPRIFHGGFHAAYDWTEELGRWAWSEAFDDLREDPQGVAPALRDALRRTGQPAGRVLRFIENNDTGPRFITRHGPEVTRLAAVLSFTVPGIPSLYTGQEIGAELEPYQEELAPIDWSRDPYGMAAFYRRLISVRQGHGSLRGGALDVLATEPDGDVLAYARHLGPGDGDDAPVLVVLNFGGAREVRVSMPASLRRSFEGAALHDPLEGTVPPVRPEAGGLVIEMGPTDAEILTPAPR